MGFPPHGISTPWDFHPMGFPPHGISTPRGAGGGFFVAHLDYGPGPNSPERLSTHLWNVAQKIFLKSCTVGHAPVHSTKRNRFSQLDLFFVDQP